MSPNIVNTVKECIFGDAKLVVYEEEKLWPQIIL